MGYRRQSTIFELKFEDPSLDGLIVQARKPAMDGMLDTIRFQDISSINPSKLSSSDADRLREMFEFFGGFLVEWNLEDEEGNPVPCTVKGLLSQDVPFVWAILSAWIKAVHTVPVPLDVRSNGGPPLEVASIPMEIL